MPSFTFTKEERLKSRKVISKIFKEGHSFNAYPLRLIWVDNHSSDSMSPIQVAFSVPKKSFPKAVERNRLKRKVREAYRLHKHDLYKFIQNDDNKFAFMILYIAKDELDYQEIEKGMRKMIKKWLEKQSKE